MQTLRSLLALRENHTDEPVKPGDFLSQTFKNADFWHAVGVKDPEAVGLESADIEVYFEYEPSDYTMHPYGSTHAREDHAETFSIQHVLLKHDATVYDEDGDKAVKVLKAGTDLLQKSWWQDDWTEHLESKLDAPGHDDYDPREDDRYFDRY